MIKTIILRRMFFFLYMLIIYLYTSNRHVQRYTTSVHRQTCRYTCTLTAVMFFNTSDFLSPLSNGVLLLFIVHDELISHNLSIAPSRRVTSFLLCLSTPRAYRRRRPTGTTVITLLHAAQVMDVVSYTQSRASQERLTMV